jgi:hypothetical protein
MAMFRCSGMIILKPALSRQSSSIQNHIFAKGTASRQTCSTSSQTESAFVQIRPASSQTESAFMQGLPSRRLILRGGNKMTYSVSANKFLIFS